MHLLNASLVLLAAIWARWQGQPPIKTGFFSKNLEPTELHFPTMALVLSTLKLAQFCHAIPSDWKILSSQKFYMLYQHFHRQLNTYYRNVQIVFDRLISNILTAIGFIFCTPLLLDPSCPTVKEWFLQWSIICLWYGWSTLLIMQNVLVFEHV